MSGSASLRWPTRLAGCDAFTRDVFGDSVAVPVNRPRYLARLEEAGEVGVLVPQTFCGFSSRDVALHLTPRRVAACGGTSEKGHNLFGFLAGLGGRLKVRAVRCGVVFAEVVDRVAVRLLDHHELIQRPLARLGVPALALYPLHLLSLRSLDLTTAIVIALLGYVKGVCVIIWRKF